MLNMPTDAAPETAAKEEAPQPTGDPQLPPTLDALIVGAGFAGLYQLYSLRNLGLSAHLVEAAPDIGGTWFWNRYPGARCDIESVDYSYSFSEELEQEWNWSERYAAQPEILSYINHVADRFSLREQITCNTRIVSATYSSADARWEVRTEAGNATKARFLVMATGVLSAARRPAFPGLDTFGGAWYHTGAWPTEEIDFSGRSVGVIGTGSTAIQLIPQLARRAAQVTVFQRTPSYATSSVNWKLTEAELNEIKATYPERRERARRTIFGLPMGRPTQSALKVSEAEREATYRAGWDQGTLLGILNSYYDLMLDPAANETASNFIRERIREIVDEPETAELLIPRDYPYGAKRPCLEDGYFASFNRDNVRLVNLREHPIESISPNGVVTSEREYDLDAIVFATGFDAMTGALAAIDIRGIDGQSLRDKWSAGPRNYLGLATAGFPNLFLVTGPGSPSVLSNVMLAIEQHVEWITACIDHLDSQGLATIEATQEAEDKWTDHVTEMSTRTLHRTANSWYLGANVPGKPRVFMPYVGGFDRYSRICADVAAEDYRGFNLDVGAGAVS
jgi:cyclohexanone monooxygenase